MEENQDSSLFGLTIDSTSKAHLYETARWAKFLAIVGFVFIGLIILFFLFAGVFFGAMSADLSRSGVSSITTGIAGAFQFVFLILMAVLYFFPCLFLFQFAVKMKSALAANDQVVLNTSFQNIKKLFRYLGIFTIIGLSFYAILLLVALLGLGLTR